ncbi:MAG TPA: hypothetical protein VFY66_01490 [Anaerolineales bacterium]|nr:hypothetical protein [Anaerolineales bacterium]
MLPARNLLSLQSAFTNIRLVPATSAYASPPSQDDHRLIYTLRFYLFDLAELNCIYSLVFHLPYQP